MSLSSSKQVDAHAQVWSLVKVGSSAEDLYLGVMCLPTSPASKPSVFLRVVVVWFFSSSFELLTFVVLFSDD